MNKRGEVLSEDAKILHYMKSALKYYNTIRGENKKDVEYMFWDAVILLASDDSQRAAYEIQINHKQERLELPLGVPFHIFADPPGDKVGCGGATMFVLEQLAELYGSLLFDMRLLLIPAGGYSQRLPSLSILGKLFSPLPLNDQMYQMIDLILAAYLPFLQKMRPGVFLTSSDAIISYYINENDNWTFEQEGFTALAHPSPISIGTQHGVYVLPQDLDFNQGSCLMSQCIEVLQKPSIKDMREKGALLRNNLHKGDDTSEEIIFSDSVFFFDSSIVLKLINFYKEVKPVHCEISSYGDFLQPLGTRSNFSLSYSTFTETTNAGELTVMRQKLCQLLKGSPLHILVLKQSTFHHLGTMTEYIENLCLGGKFSEHFQTSRFAFSITSVEGIPMRYIKGTVLHSVVHPLSTIAQTALVEYCNFSIAMDIGEYSIISNCQLGGSDVTRVPYQIPPNTLVHTVGVENGYVTVAFGINDDIKRNYCREDAFDVKYFNKNLKDILSLCSMNHDIFDPKLDVVSLWSAKLFPLCATMDESLRMTIVIIRAIINSSHLHQRALSRSVYLSMKDILVCKDVSKMLDYRKDLLHQLYTKEITKK